MPYFSCRSVVFYIFSFEHLLNCHKSGNHILLISYEIRWFINKGFAFFFPKYIICYEPMRLIPVNSGSQYFVRRRSLQTLSEDADP